LGVLKWKPVFSMEILKMKGLKKKKTVEKIVNLKK
jgi:hypothetical protein